MCPAAENKTDDPTIIQPVNDYPTGCIGCMDDGLMIYKDANMRNFPFFIIKKSQITRLAFFNKT